MAPNKEISRGMKKGADNESNAYAYLENLSTATLESMLVQLADVEFDEELELAILNTIMQREEPLSQTQIETAIEDFHTRYPDAFDVGVSDIEPPAKPPRKRPQWQKWTAIAASIVLVIALTFAAFPSSAANIFRVIQEFFDTTIGYITGRGGQGQQDVQDGQVSVQGKEDYASLEDACIDLGLNVALPTRLPDGFTLKDIQSFIVDPTVNLMALFSDSTRSIMIQIYSSPASTLEFEKLIESAESVYTVDGVDHLISHNNTQLRASWLDEQSLVSVSGDISEDQLKQIIDSMYE